MEQLINEPTYITNKWSSCIDFFFKKIIYRIKSLETDVWITYIQTP